ncbi:hypothetical protein EYE40_05065 [Glaciihabitans arcticus]|uniref:Lipocalin-like domain-containing protein n=1 Tax=Glaciihabitans arcticus TaxID=2668039 RepID=A0A4V2JET1_9MICO|nr:hypothetical protein [Glaciihabitans arcticus]TBN56819.1 hypothetical protein EYE40_05065 [Glaciihabitans arcticus]
MTSRIVAAVLAAPLAILTLVGCTGEPAPAPAPTSTVTTPQASFDGEWTLTRTITASNDVSGETRAVGAVSTRLVLLDQTPCDAVICPGMVWSGTTADAREQTPLTQIDGGVSWRFTGSLDCMRAESEAVLVLDAFDYSQEVELLVTESADVDGVLTATGLSGSIVYTDTLSKEAIAKGCVRDPVETTIEYSVTAVRNTEGL